MKKRLRCAAGMLLAVTMLAMLAVPLFPARAEDVSEVSVPTEIVTEEPISEDVTEEPSTEPPTETITEAVTEAPTEPETEKVTEAATEAPTEPPTEPETVTEEIPAILPERNAEETVTERATKAASSPWTFHNSGWGSGETWYIYCPPGSMYSKFSAEKDGVTKVAYCLNRELSSPKPSLNYQVAAYPTSKHYTVAKIVAALGYPNNSVARIKEMTGYDLTAIQAQQATQVAIGAAQKAVAEGWTADKTYSSYVSARSGYQSVFDYSKFLCTRALELLNNSGTAAKYTVTASVTNALLTSKVAVSITPYKAYGQYKIVIKNLPAGTLLTTGQNTRVIDSSGNLVTAKNQAVSGTVTIRGLGGTTGANVGKFTLSSIPKGSSARTITISATSFAKLAATDEVEWGKSPDSSHQHMFIAGLAEGATVTASNTAAIPKLPAGSITVVKRDATNNKTLAGCVFGLKKWNGSTYADTGTTKTTGSDGKATFSGLTTDATSGGKYQVYEISAPAGYEADSGFYFNFVVGSGWYRYKSALVSDQSDTLSSGGTVNATINGASRPILTVSKSGDNYSATVYQYDTPKPPDTFSITLNKRDLSTGNALTGATYQLYTANASGAWVAFKSGTVNSGGTLVFTGLKATDSSNGKFRVVESAMSNGDYLRDEAFAVVVNPTNGQWSYSGSFANKSGTFTSASTVSSSISIPGGGSVNRSIIKGDKPDTLWDFTVWQDDQKKPSQHLTVRKVVPVDGEDWAVSGISFALMKQNGNQWQNVGNLVEQSGNAGVYQVPESDGTWTFPMTEGATYKVKETAAGNGVVNSGWESSSFVWHEGDSISLSFTATDQIPKGHIGILKQDSETNAPIPGVGFTVTAAEQIVTRIGNRSVTWYESGEVVMEGVTDAQGKLLVRDLPYGKYTVTETTHPAGYTYENVSFSVTVGAPSGYSNSNVYTDPMIGYATYPAGMTVTTANGLRYVTVGNIPIHPKMAVSKLTERTVNPSGNTVSFDAAKGRYSEQKVPGTYCNDQNAKFTITVTNTGDVELHDLRIVDVMSAKLWSVVKTDGAPVHWRQVNDNPLVLGGELAKGNQVTTTKGNKATVTEVEYDSENRAITIAFDHLAVGDSFRIQIACPIFNAANMNQENLPNDVYLYAKYKVNGTQGVMVEVPGGGEGDCHDADALNVDSQGDVTIRKQDAKSLPQAGVHFLLTDQSKRPICFVLLDNGDYAATLRRSNGDWVTAASSGQPTTTDLVTGSAGEIRLTELPEGSYVLTETQTLEGQSLLSQPIPIEMPLVKSGAEIRYEGNVYFDGKNHFYHQGFTVTNSAQFELPMTGGTFGTRVPVLMGFLLILGCSVLLLHQKYRFPVGRRPAII